MVLKFCCFRESGLGVQVINSSNAIIEDSVFESCVTGLAVTIKSRATVNRCAFKKCIFAAATTDNASAIIKNIEIKESVFGIMLENARLNICSSNIRENICGVSVVMSSQCSMANCDLLGSDMFSSSLWKNIPNTKQAPIEKIKGYLESTYDWNWDAIGVSVDESSSIDLTRCRISDNTNADIHAIHFANVKMNECEINGNGVGMEVSKLATATGVKCKIQSNRSAGVKSLTGGTLHLTDSQIDHNGTGVVIENQGRGFFERTKVFDNGLEQKGGARSNPQTPQDWIISPDSAKNVTRKE